MKKLCVLLSPVYVNQLLLMNKNLSNYPQCVPRKDIYSRVVSRQQSYTTPDRNDNTN